MPEVHSYNPSKLFYVSEYTLFETLDTIFTVVIIETIIQQKGIFTTVSSAVIRLLRGTQV